MVATGYGANSTVYDTATGAALFPLQKHAGSPTAVAYSPDGARIATASEDKTVRMWLAKDGPEVLALKDHTSLFPSGSRSPPTGTSW